MAAADVVRERVRLGRTGVEVTRVGLGTAALGGLYEAVGEEQAEAAIGRAWDAGIRFFDTAPLYGSGLAERRAGAWLRGQPRDDYALSTKVGRLLRPDAPPDPTQLHEGVPFYKGTPPLQPVRDYSRDGTLRSLEESLGRLGLDRVDVVQIHDPDDHVEEALAGACRALERLRDEGVVGAYGVGANSWQTLARFVREADLDCVLCAGRYTVLDRSALAELLPLCLDRGVAIVAAGLLNSGILAAPRPGARFDYVPAPPAALERARRLEAICRRRGVDLLAAALQFPLAHPAVTAILIGPRSAHELDQSLAALSAPLPASLWEELAGETLDAPPRP